MRGLIAIVVAGLMAGCAGNQGSLASQDGPTDACQEINPDSSMLSLASPVPTGKGVKVGSVAANVRDGRCEIVSAIYIDTEVLAKEISRTSNQSESEAFRLIQTDAFRQHMTDRVTSQAQDSFQQFPKNTIRARYQYLPTPPMPPFTVTVEN